MTHIKRIVEMLSNDSQNVLYVIKNVTLTVYENNFSTGEVNTENNKYTEFDPEMSSESLIDLLQQFVKEYCNGHKFDINEWMHDGSNRLELEIPSKLTNDDFDFIEPTKQDWDDFKNGKCNFSSFQYDLYIEKQEVSDDLNNDFQKLGIQEF